METGPVEELGSDLIRFRLQDFEAEFDQILEELFQARSQWSYSHKIRGRWENTYVPICEVPSVRTVLNLAAQLASRRANKTLVCGQGMLRDSFWFNLMEKDEETGWHNHKSKAEASGVCYLKVPDNSGDFLYRLPDGTTRKLKPKPGAMLLFPSSLNHSVSASNSDDTRISLAFNLFSLPLELEPEDPFGGHPLYR